LTLVYENMKVPDHIKIPNLEVQNLLDQKLKKFLNSIPIEGECISNLSKAMIEEDFKKFGFELAKSLSKFDCNQKNLTYKGYIHGLMSQLFANLNPNFENEVDTKISVKLGKSKSIMQFRFKNAEKGQKTYYIIWQDITYWYNNDVN
jgi:hypothetical protein